MDIMQNQRQVCEATVQKRFVHLCVVVGLGTSFFSRMCHCLHQTAHSFIRSCLQNKAHAESFTTLLVSRPRFAFLFCAKMIHFFPKLNCIKMLFFFLTVYLHTLFPLEDLYYSLALKSIDYLIFLKINSATALNYYVRNHQTDF